MALGKSEVVKGGMGILLLSAALVLVYSFGNIPGGSDGEVSEEVGRQRRSDGSDRDWTWEMNSVDTTKIREYLKVLSEEPHMAGLDRDKFLVDWLSETWRSFGLDEVKTRGYNMLMDYPDRDKPNMISINRGSGEEIFRSHYKEEGVDNPNFVYAFNAYSKSGNVSGLPVYVNYGSIEDFQQLRNMSVDLNNKICIARYGKIFRGNKADNGAKFGCVGLIIYSDPMEVACEGTDPSQVYPNSFWLPGTGMQRGSLALVDGDPLTPYWPSVENAYELPEDQVNEALPTIPVQPIGYSDAEQILSRMGGLIAPQEWQGEIADLIYRIGGEFNMECSDCMVKMNVNNKREKRESKNVIGIVYGSEEPDRYVMLGNHRDAWGFGAVDPSSGTAQMIEVARIVGDKLKMGWRPKRTLMFLSWGAEEFSLSGSREFVEEYQIQLEDRGVAYINTDVCMSGQYLEPASSPTLGHLFKSATQDVWSPDGEGSYYDFWKRYENISMEDDFEPEVVLSPGAGSDHATFIYLAGVPVLDIAFGPDRKKYPKISGYPMYHTGYETFKLVDEIYDPEYLIFRACSQLNLRLGLELVDTEILPMKIEAYADVMEDAFSAMESNGLIEKLSGLGVETKYLKEAITNFRPSVEAWRINMNDQDLTNALVRRTINDQIRGFEGAFLLYSGLPDRMQYRHAIIAPSQFDAYGGAAFPGLGDLVHGIEEMSESDRAVQIEKLKRHTSDLMILVNRAAKYLQPLPIIGF